MTVSKQYLSMAQAAKICPYEQGYLSLLARRKQLQAMKIGKKWFTTIDWLNDYLKVQRPDYVIEVHKKEDKIVALSAAKSGSVEIQTNNSRNVIKTFVETELNPLKWEFYKTKGWVVVAVVIAVSIFFAFQYLLVKIDRLEQEAKKNEFVPEQIMKVPNENGSYDIYGVGKMKLGQEKNNTVNNK